MAAFEGTEINTQAAASSRALAVCVNAMQVCVSVCVCGFFVRELCLERQMGERATTVGFRPTSSLWSQGEFISACVHTDRK